MAPPVQEKFADYVCMNVKDNPWAASYDIRRDGVIGVDDIKARLITDREMDADKDKKTLDVSCQQIKASFIETEVRWKLQGLIAGFGSDTKKETVLAQITALESDALPRLEAFSKGMEDSRITTTVRSAVVEMSLRARNIVNETETDEPFGIGVDLKPDVSDDTWWPIVIGAVHPASAAAAAGLISGDRIVAIDNASITEWSSNGTFDGLADPNTQIVRGLSGKRGSDVLLGIKRDGAGFSIVVKRNIWSGRHLGTPNSFPAWNGEQTFLPPITATTK